MVLVSPSKCPIGASVSHEEVHKEDVAAFYIAVTPVTNAGYQQFVEETGYPPPGRNSVGNKEQIWSGNGFPEDVADHPVVNVSWKDATEYCKWLAKKTGKPYRLPAEEEWEVAARGGAKGPYPWGEGIDKAMAWHGAKWLGPQTLMPADYGRANAYGLYGMAGNVWQWVEDWFVPTFNGRPVEEELKLFKVIRGGSWANSEGFLTVNYRNHHPPDFKDFFIGFRVARAAD
jgi:formylglycine-generating enzyme required for sulfatase activity